MCETPGVMADGTKIPCRKCWQCRERKIDDWVGRCIAESKTSKSAHFITLTYGRVDNEVDHYRAAWLTYSDVQKFFKLLRFNGYKFRYIVTGEFGEQKGRCHWHLLMFWLTDPPPHKLSIGKEGIRCHIKEWPHGHTVWRKVSPASARYVCKYIQKDQGEDESQAHLSMSKKPPLGHLYFQQMAMKYVEQGLSPQSHKYTFPDVLNKDRTRKEFYMTGTTRSNFLEHYKALWLRHQGGFHPYSEIIEEHDDAIARRDYLPAKEPFRPRIYPPVGCGPIREGKCPQDDNRMRLYSDGELYRFWYLPDDEGYTWQREKISGAIESLSLPPPRENQYGKAKRGRDEAKASQRSR